MGIKYAPIHETAETGEPDQNGKSSIRKLEEEISDIGPKAKSKGGKRLVSIRYDDEVLDFFEALGKGWQTQMNTILLQYVRDHSGT